MEILPYNKELLKDFIYNGVERDYLGEDIIPIVEFYNKLGKVYVGKIDGKVIGVGGAYPLWKQAGSFFLFLNKEAKNYKKSVYIVLVQYMNNLIKEYDIKTLIVDCNEESKEAKSLITHLGFIKSKAISMAQYTRGV